MKTTIVAALAVTALASACGGEDVGERPEPILCRPILPVSHEPDPGSGRVDCSALDGYELYFIDTFEDGEASPSWYTNNDHTAEQIPNPGGAPPVASVIPGGRCVGGEPSENAPTACSDPSEPRGSCERVVSPESRRAVHIRTGFLSSNGGQLGQNFPKRDCRAPASKDECKYMGMPGPPERGPCSPGEGPSPPQVGCAAARDTSDWDGIVVWARVAPGSANGVRIRVSDARTDEAACLCNPFTDANDSSDGCDKFGRHVALDTDFRPYFVAFDDMQQGGWGMKSPGLDRGNLFSFAFEYGRGSWDLWIDDIAFYRRRP